MTLPRLAFVLILAGSALGVAAPAIAQPALPESVVRASDLSDQARQQIRDYPGEALSRLLRSSEARDIRAGRERLLAPLRDSQVSVRFRQTYSDTIAPSLVEMASASSPDVTAVNALRVLGELATPAGLDALEAALADKRVAVRYTAVLGLERSINSLRQGGSAIAQDRALQSVSRLADVVAKDQSPEVVHAAVRALGSLFDFDREGLANIRPQALAALEAATKDRFRPLVGAPAVSMQPAMLAAAQAARNALSNVRIPLTPELTKQAAGIAADAFTSVFLSVRAGDFKKSPGSRDLAALIVAESEAAGLVAAKNTGQPLNLADELRKSSDAGDAEFQNKALRFYNTLNEALAFAPDRFIK